MHWRGTYGRMVKTKIIRVLEYVMCVAVPVAFFLIFRITAVSGESMENTYKDGDHVLISTLGKPKKGDVIIVRAKVDGKEIRLIKRLIATEGDEVVIDYDTHTLSVNGETLSEPYLKDILIQSEDTVSEPLQYPYVVPEGHIFIVGDNREHSVDSRDTGVEPIKESDIIGRVVLKLL